MKKRLYSIIAFAVLLVALIGVYIFVAHKNSSKKNTTPTTTTSKDIVITSFSKNKISKINISSKNGSLEIVHKDNKWTIPAYTFKIDESIIESMSAYLCKPTANRKIEDNASDLSKYGLDKPQANIKMTLSDGTEKTYLLGNSATGGYYYFMINGEKTVYAIADVNGNYFLATISDFGDKTIMTFASANMNYIKIARDGKKTFEMEKNQNQTTVEKQYEMHAWNYLQPYQTSYGGDDNNMKILLTKVDEIAITSLIDCKPADLSKYGLNKPKLDITMKDSSKKQIELLFGNDKDSSEVYFKTSDSNCVYTMSKTTVDYFTQISDFDFTQKYIYTTNLDNVDKIIITGKGRSDEITITRSAKSSSSSTNANNDDTNVYTLNGKKVDNKKFTDFYQALIALDADAENDKSLGDSSDLKVEFKLNAGSNKDIVVNYIPYNENFYGASVNGKCDFVLSINKVNEALKLLDALK